MGVSGSGKSSVGVRLAERLGCPFEEGDDLHPPQNVAKMAAGQPLTDEDRWPWLDAVSAWIAARVRAGTGGVISCSALRRIYRERLTQRAGNALRIVYLHGSAAVIAERLAHRVGHFMPPELLPSQLATLEEPAADERVITVRTDGLTVEEVVARVVAALGA